MKMPRPPSLSQTDKHKAAHLTELKKLDVGDLMGSKQHQGVAGAAHAGSTAHPVHKGGGVLRGVILHNPVHMRDVKPPCRHISAQQAACSTRARLITPVLSGCMLLGPVHSRVPSPLAA